MSGGSRAHRRDIWCCGCGATVQARLTTGAEVYPQRADLGGLPFWMCDGCRNYVGCHHKTKDRTRPLGNIPTPAIRSARQHIHAILDPLWKGGKRTRGQVYATLSARIGRAYHTAEIATLEDARAVYRAVQAMVREAAHG